MRLQGKRRRIGLFIGAAIVLPTTASIAYQGESTPHPTTNVDDVTDDVRAGAPSERPIPLVKDMASELPEPETGPVDRDAVSVPADDPAMIHLSEELDIPRDEARVRIQQQEVANPIGAIIAERYPSVYGGVWVDQQDGGRVKVAATDSIDRIALTLRELGVDSYADVVRVDHTRSDLDEAMSWLRDQVDRSSEQVSRSVQISNSTDDNAITLRVSSAAGDEQVAQFVSDVTTHIGDYVNVEWATDDLIWESYAECDNTGVSRRCVAVSSFDGQAETVRLALVLEAGPPQATIIR
jgi:hypothetical protein